MKPSVLIGAFLLITATSALATPAELTVDQPTSNVSVTLCLTVTSTQCGTDTSPVAGQITLGLDCLTNPTMLTLYDFDFLLTSTLDFHLNYGFIVGRFDATATNVALHYATPGIPQPPTPLTGGMFTYANVPDTATGSLAYTSTNLVCAGLQGAGYLCADTIDLSTLGVNSITLDGTAVITGRNIAVTLNVNSTAPLDPTNPGLGSLTTIGTIKASGAVPLPSIADFVGVLTGTVIQQDLVCESDINFDGAANGLDVQGYVDALLGP